MDEKVERTRVRFDSGGVELVGYLHHSADAVGRLPGVVMGHGFSGTQDRLFDNAERFAGAGFAALTFDYRSFGESGGEPRQVVSVEEQLEDWRAAIRFARGSWKYHGITAERLEQDLRGLPALLDHCDQLCRDGIMGAAHATAADLQIGATLRNFLAIGDLLPVMDGRRCAEVARSLFGEPAKVIPAGAYPAGWVVTG